MSKPAKEVSIKWVAIGAILIFGLNKLLRIFLDQPVGNALIEHMPTTGLYLYIILIAVGSFFVGGLLVSWLSPGETITEPAYATIVAILANGILNFIEEQQTFQFSWLLGLAITAVVSFALGLAGAWVGEKLQGDTTDKMRERGEFGQL